MNSHNRQAIEDRLQEIAERDGRLTADAVIEDAKSPESPLHTEFEWDVDKAALEYWREQARRLIRSVRVTVTVEHHTMAVPRYVKSPEYPLREQAYADSQQIKPDREKSRQAIAYELERAEAAIKRARYVGIALELEEEVQSILESLVSMKEKVKAA